MSDEEIKKLLKQNIEISSESLKLLKKLNKARIMDNVYWAVKWAVIIGISFGAYYYIEPYFNKYIETIKKLAPLSKANGADNLSGANISSGLNLIDKLEKAAGMGKK